MAETKTSIPGYNVCYEEGCNNQDLRLSGYCLKHDTEHLIKILDMPSYDDPVPLDVKAIKTAMFRMSIDERIEILKYFCKSCGRVIPFCFCLKPDNVLL